jgi:WD40 repeat protein
VRTLTFSPDGKTLAGVAEEWDAAARRTTSTLWLWDTATGRLRQRPSQRVRVVRQVYFDACGQPVAVGVEEGEIRFWNVRSGQIIRRLRPARGRLELSGCLALSPDGVWVAACSLINLWRPGDGSTSFVQTTHLWRLDTGKEMGTWTTRCLDHWYRWPEKTGAPMRTRELRGNRYLPPTGLLPALVFSPDGRFLAEVDLEGILRVRDTASGKELCRQPSRQNPRSVIYSDIRWLPDSKQVTIMARYPKHVGFSGDAGDPRNGVRILDVAKGELRQPGPSFREPRLVSPDGSVMLGRDVYSWISLLDPRTGKEPQKNPLRRRPLRSWDALVLPLFSPSGRLLALADAPLGRVRLVEVAICREVGAFFGHTDEVTGMVFSDDGKFLLTGSQDGTAGLWEVAGAAGQLPPSSKPTRGQLLRWWDDLLSSQAREAHVALWGLVRSGDEATAFIAQHLQTTGNLRGWQRLAEPLRFGRAVEALEQIGTKGALEALRTIAERGNGDELRQRARATCRRLERLGKQQR